MKICKVEITKKLTGSICSNIYPSNYNPHTVNIIAYDEEPLVEGDNIGYCIGLVANDFSFNSEMTEITQAEAGTFIDARADVIEDIDLRAEFATARKQIITDAGI
jgi:hypothetical protein